MNYKSIEVNRPASRGTSFKDEIDRAILSLDQDGYDVVAVFPIPKVWGDTKSVMVIGKKRN